MCHWLPHSSPRRPSPKGQIEAHTEYKAKKGGHFLYLGKIARAVAALAQIRLIVCKEKVSLVKVRFSIEGHI